MALLAPLPLAIPVLETPRLLLRGYRPADFAPYLAMWQEPSFYRFLTPGPPAEEEVWTILLRSTGHWALQGFGFWAIEEKATGQFIGAVGFADGKRNIEPSIKGVPEIGWVLAAHAHGRGLATEAVGAALDWAEAHFGAGRTVCIMHPDNRASRRVAEKFGYREYRRTTYKSQSTVMLERISPQPEPTL